MPLLFGGQGRSLLGFDSERNTEDELQREIDNARLRLGVAGLGEQAAPQPDKPGVLDTVFRTLNVPGSVIRSLLLEGLDDEKGLDLSRAFGSDRLWKNQVQGIQLLDLMGLVPQQTQGFSAGNVGRFLGGLGVDLLTDPLTYLTGGVTRGLKFGTPALPFIPRAETALTQRGLLTPFAEGFTAGFRGPAAADLAQAARAAVQNAPNAAQLAQDLTFRPSGLQQAAGLRVGEFGRSVRGLFPNAATDPEALGLLRRRDAQTTLEQGRAINMVNDLARNIADPAQRRVVADLVENPDLLNQFGVASPLARGQKVADVLQTGGQYAGTLQALEQARATKLQAAAQRFGTAVPEELNQLAFQKTLQGSWDEAHDLYKAINPEYHALTETLERASATRGAVMPPEVERAYKMSLALTGSMGSREVQRGLLASLLSNYFPHMLEPTPRNALLGARSSISTSFGAQLQRAGPQTLEEAAQRGVPFVREFQFPLAKRLADDIRAVNNFDLIDEMLRQFGVKADTVAQRLGVATNAVPADALGAGFTKFAGTGKLARLGEHYIPENIKYALDRLTRAYTTDDGIEAFKKIYDYTTNKWRPLVTTLSPGFHMNNFLGNTWNMFLGGMDNPTRWNDGWNIFKEGRTGVMTAGGRQIDYTTLRELALQNGVLDSGFFRGEIGQQVMNLVNMGVPGRRGGVMGTLEKAAEAVGKLGRGAGELVEGTSRAALFADQMGKKIAALPRGAPLTDDVLQKMASEATDHVNTYLFDYRNGLSVFENEVARRVAPFWSWTRFNIPLQIVELANQPGKALLFDKTRDNLASLRPVPEDTPPWLKDALPTPFDAPQGGRVFFNPKLPVADINRLSPGESGRELLGMLAPQLKIPGQLATNKDFFTGKDIQRTPGETVPTPLPLRPLTALTETLGLKERDLTPAVGDRMDPRWAKVYDDLTGIAGRAGRAPDLLLRDDVSDVDTLRAARIAFPGLYTYDQKRAREQRLYAERSRLQALLRKVKNETGQAAPTAREARGGF